MLSASLPRLLSPKGSLCNEKGKHKQEVASALLEKKKKIIPMSDTLARIYSIQIRKKSCLGYNTCFRMDLCVSCVVGITVQVHTETYC